MEFTVGGRKLELTATEVTANLKGIVPEPLREHLVEIGGHNYPPKQVLAVVTGWERQSYTTFEAQRVLQRLGFECRRVGEGGGGGGATGPGTGAVGDEPERDLSSRLALVEAQLATAQLAIAELSAKVRRLERDR